MIKFSLKKESAKLALLSFLLFSTALTAKFNPALAVNPTKQPAATPTPSANQNPTKTSITISPPSYELTANPGDPVENVIKVTSQAEDIVTYDVLVEDFTVEGTEGSVALKGENDNPNAFSKWFKVTPSTFTLKKGETKNIQFRIDVPSNAEPGGHFASLLFQPKAVASSSSTGAQVLQRVGSLVLMTVSGAINEKGSVLKLSPKEYIGNYETVVSEDGKTKVYSPRDEKLNEEKPKSYFNNGPVAFDLTLKNEGNVFYRPQGTVTIYNVFGQKVDELQIEPKNVFPGGERRITIIWPKKQLWGMRYRANLVALYGSKNQQTLTAETSFWAFPTTAAIVIGGALVLILLLRKRLFKAFAILAKG